MELLIAVVLLGLTAAAVLAAWKVQARAGAAGRLLLRSELRIAELRRLEQGRRSLADVQKLAEGTVEGGTRVVQAVHYGIASIPFTILEAIPVTRDTTKVVRKTHNFIADGVYGSISAVNRGIGWLLKRRV